MIYDTFTFFNELDILRIRLEELSPVVDHFVIVEGDTTFQGQHKGCWLELPGAMELFQQYGDQIIGFTARVPKEITDPWQREYYQRNEIATCLRQLHMTPDDIVLISDADEIPRRSVVEAIKPDPVQSIALQAYYYGLNTKADHMHTIRAVRYELLQHMTPQQIRTLDPPPSIVYDGGWHFSYLGDAEHIANKFRAFAHSELNRPDTTDPAILQARMEAHTDLWGDGHDYEVVEIDDTWPEAVKRDPEYWSKYVWQRPQD